MQGQTERERLCVQQQVRDEERRREQTDRGQPDAVRVRELLRDGAGVRDVPARGEPGRAAARDGKPNVHAAPRPDIVRA